MSKKATAATAASPDFTSMFAGLNEPGFSVDDFLATVGDTATGYAVAISGIALVGLSAALLTGTLLVGFWTTLMLGFLSILIAALTVYVAYMVCTSCEPASFEALGKKTGSAWSKVSGIFSRKAEEPAAAPAAAI